MPTAAQNAANSADRIATACKETHPMFERIPRIRPQLTRHRPVERHGCRLEQARRPATDADWSSTALNSAHGAFQLDVPGGVPRKGTGELT
jgi:hypothetical protein